MNKPELQGLSIRIAEPSDKDQVVDFSYRLNKTEHNELKRAEKIEKAISNQECFVININEMAVGFALFDYRFFDQGWIELIVIDKEQRAKGIGAQVIELICLQSRTDKVFTSTNRSNIPMQKALSKAGFTYAGELSGLDEGDPELFYYKNRRE